MAESWRSRRCDIGDTSPRICGAVDITFYSCKTRRMKQRKTREREKKNNKNKRRYKCACIYINMSETDGQIVRLSPSVKSLRLRPGAHRVARPVTLWEAIASWNFLKMMSASNVTTPPSSDRDEPQSFYLFHPEILSPYIKRVSLVTLQVLRHDGKASHDIPGILGRGNLDTSSAAALGRPLIPFTDFST